MYIPKSFKNTNEKEILSFMQKYSFATIVSVSDERPIATHLPFVVSKEEDNIVLYSHFAKVNPQAGALVGKSILVIFCEPHAYISPRYYAKKENVPTWNYISVHAYGRATIIEEEAAKLDLLEKTINTYEEEYKPQWNKLSANYKTAMIAGITAFKITVTEVQAANKLSQNKSSEERRNIVKGLSESSHSSATAIAEYMKQNLSE
jgi:transcriptional regulator